LYYDDAGILDVFQGGIVQYGGKSASRCATKPLGGLFAVLPIGKASKSTIPMKGFFYESLFGRF
jgi:hypothetical protein